MKKESLRLYLVTDRMTAAGRNVRDVVAAALKGGVTMVQIREKDASARDVISLARAVRELAAPYGVPVVINDRVDIAVAAGADGVHLGRSDIPCDVARAILGPDKIVGLTVENMGQIFIANELEADYIGVSPIYATPTKTDTGCPFGLKDLATAVEISTLPVVAIGGVNIGTAPDIIRCGVDGIAVVSAIMGSEDPGLAASELRKLWGNLN